MDESKVQTETEGNHRETKAHSTKKLHHHNEWMNQLRRKITSINSKIDGITEEKQGITGASMLETAQQQAFKKHKWKKTANSHQSTALSITSSVNLIAASNQLITKQVMDVTDLMHQVNNQTDCYKSWSCSGAISKCLLLALQLTSSLQLVGYSTCQYPFFMQP